MIPQGRQGPHAIGDHDDRGEASGKNAEIIHEVVENIQHIQAG